MTSVITIDLTGKVNINMGEISEMKFGGDDDS